MLCVASTSHLVDRLLSLLGLYVLFVVVAVVVKVVVSFLPGDLLLYRLQ